MVDYLHSAPALTQKIRDILEFNKEVLGVQRIYYGQQDLIPDYPAIVVESGTKDRGLIDGSTRRFEIILRCTIFVYIGKVQSSEVTEAEAEQLAEQVEDVLHTDMTIGNSVVFGYVTQSTPGVALRQQTMIRTIRLTWEGQSRQTF